MFPDKGNRLNLVRMNYQQEQDNLPVDFEQLFY